MNLHYTSTFLVLILGLISFANSQKLTSVSAISVDAKELTLAWQVTGDEWDHFLIRRNPGNKEYVVKDGKTRELKIGDLTPCQKYTFKVDAFAKSDGKITASQTVTVSTTPSGPGGLKSVKATANNAKEITVTVEDESPRQSCGKYFYIFTLEEDSTKKIVDSQASTTSVFFSPTVENDKKYTLRVKLFEKITNKFGNEVKTDYTHKNKEAPAGEAPEYINVDSFTKEGVVLTWAGIERGVEKFELTYQKANGKTHYVKGTSLLKDLDGCSLYGVRVRALDGAKYGLYSKEVTFKTGSVGKPEKPIVEVEHISRDQVVFSIKAAEKDLQSCGHFKYFIEVKDYWDHFKRETNGSAVVVDDLWSNTEYTVTAYTMETTSQEVGPQLTFTIKSKGYGTPVNEAPSGLKGMPGKKSMIEVSWEAPSWPGTPVLGYQLTVFDASGVKHIYTLGTETKFAFKATDACSQYSGFVRAIYNDGPGESSNVALFASSSVFPVSGAMIVPINAETVEVRISDNVFRHKCMNHHFLYKVSIIKVSDGATVSAEISPIRTVTLGNLKSGVEYVAQITVFDATTKNYSPMFKSGVFKSGTKESECQDVSSMNLKVTKTGQDALTLQWDAPKMKPGVSIGEYEIVLFRGVVPFAVAKTDKTTYTFDRLTFCTMFEARVTVINSKKEPCASVSIPVKTYPPGAPPPPSYVGGYTEDVDLAETYALPPTKLPFGCGTLEYQIQLRHKANQTVLAEYFIETDWFDFKGDLGRAGDKIEIHGRTRYVETGVYSKLIKSRFDETLPERKTPVPGKSPLPKIANISGESMVVSWDEPKVKSTYEYVIFSHDGNHFGRVLAKRGERTLELQNLKPCTKYDVSIDITLYESDARTAVENRTVSTATTLGPNPPKPDSVVIYQQDSDTMEGIIENQEPLKCGHYTYEIDIFRVEVPKPTKVQSVKVQRKEGRTTFSVKGLKPATYFVAVSTSYDGEGALRKSAAKKSTPIKFVSMKTN